MNFWMKKSYFIIGSDGKGALVSAFYKMMMLLVHLSMISTNFMVKEHAFSAYLERFCCINIFITVWYILNMTNNFNVTRTPFFYFETEVPKIIGNNNKTSSF